MTQMKRKIVITITTTTMKKKTVAALNRFTLIAQVTTNFVFVSFFSFCLLGSSFNFNTILIHQVHTQIKSKEQQQKSIFPIYSFTQSTQREKDGARERETDRT